MLHSRKGQLFASDLIASVVVFFFIVSMSLIIWNTAYNNKTQFNGERQLRERVVQSSDLLVRTPGYPHNWNDGTVKLAGFAASDHVLDNAKLRSFNATPYSKQRQVIRAREDQFYLTISVDGSVARLTEPGKPDLRLAFGNDSMTDAEVSAVNKRSILLNDSNQLERGTLKLVFWR